jgi:SAM-dependent methyltransferase
MPTLNGLISRFQRALGRMVLFKFRLDDWDYSTIREHPYAQAIVHYLNDLPEDCRVRVADVGCSLGMILRRLRFKERIGLDYNRKLVEAAHTLARLLRQRVEFSLFKFPEDKLIGVYDVIIMTNWPHHIPPNELKRGITAYLHDNLRPGGLLIIDTVSDPEYEFNHDIAFLTSGYACGAKLLGDFQHGRRVYAVQNNADCFS